MNGELEPDELLHRAVEVLRHPVPIAAGLAGRARERRRRQARVRTVQAGALVLLAGFVGVVLSRRGAETPVTFAFTAPAVHSVSVVGDFTDWRTDKVQLERTRSGLWEATVKLRPGRYRFAYLVNHAEWRADSRSAVAPDDFGRPTSILTVVKN
jgi:hypothetical protein